ncbi:unnamed protein product, partial [Pocillopora meandrina]
MARSLQLSLQMSIGNKRHTKMTAETTAKDFRIIINTKYHKISNQFRDLVQQIKEGKYFCWLLNTMRPAQAAQN